MTECLWCKKEQQSSRRLKRGEPRECPLCGHLFQGSGWDGIDAPLAGKAQ